MAIPVYNTSVITAVAKVQQGVAFPTFVMGGQGGSGGTTYKLFKKSSTYTFALFRSEKIPVGQPFKVNLIKIPLQVAVAANRTLIPVLYFDDEASSSVGTTINSTNYPNSEKYIELTPDNFAFGTMGKKDVVFELQHTGSALLPPKLPIIIEIETIETL